MTINSTPFLAFHVDGRMLNLDLVDEPVAADILIPPNVRDPLSDWVTGMTIVSAGAFSGIHQRGWVPDAQAQAAIRRGDWPMTTSDGSVLGVERGADGRVTRMIRFQPPSVFSTAMTAVPTVVLGLQLLGIQRRCARIEEILAGIQQQTGDILRLLNSDRWHEITAHAQAVAEAYRHSRELGRVPDSIWQHLQAQGTATALRRLRGQAMDAVLVHQTRLARLAPGKGAQRWLEEHARTMMRDIASLLQTDAAWLTYTGLRAAWIGDQSAIDESSLDQQRLVLADAMSDRDQIVATSLPVIDALHRSLLLQAHFAKGSKSRQANRFVAVAETLASLSGATGFDPVSPPRKLETAVRGGPRKYRSRVAEVVPLILDPGECVHSVAWMSQPRWDGFWGRTHGCAIVTDQRIILAIDEQLVRKGRISQSIPLNSVTDCRVTTKHGAMDGPNIVVRFGKHHRKIQFSDAIPTSQALDMHKIITGYPRKVTS